MLLIFKIAIVPGLLVALLLFLLPLFLYVFELCSWDLSVIISLSSAISFTFFSSVLSSYSLIRLFWILLDLKSKNNYTATKIATIILKIIKVFFFINKLKS